MFFRYEGLIGSMLALAKWAQRQSARLSTEPQAVDDHQIKWSRAIQRQEKLW